MHHDLVVMSAGWWLLDDLFFLNFPKSSTLSGLKRE